MVLRGSDTFWGAAGQAIDYLSETLGLASEELALFLLSLASNGRLFTQCACPLSF